MRNSERTRAATALTYVERVNRAIDHVVSHLGEPLRLRDLARVALLSPFHFHRVFQALVGETPADFVQRLRLDKAMRLMSSPRRPSLTTIAQTCGFAASSDFSRSFKRRFGMAPSAFDIGAWRRTHAAELEALVERNSPLSPTRERGEGGPHVQGLPPRHNPDGLRVRVRELPARTVAYLRVDRPYEGDHVLQAARRLVAWAEQHGLADGQWLGYQWDHPEITALAECRYYVAVEAERFSARGEVGRYRFPPMTVAEVVLRGGLDLELRALQWLYGSWLPRSGFVPDDQPAFEAWLGRPFAQGTEYFELAAQVPVRRG